MEFGGFTIIMTDYDCYDYYEVLCIVLEPVECSLALIYPLSTVIMWYLCVVYGMECWYTIFWALISQLESTCS